MFIAIGFKNCIIILPVVCLSNSKLKLKISICYNYHFKLNYHLNIFRHTVGKMPTEAFYLRYVSEII